MKIKELLPHERHKIKKRTRDIYYEGDRYHRRCDYHGWRIYIISFLGVNKCQIEFGDGGSQHIVEVDDDQFDLIEYKK